MVVAFENQNGEAVPTLLVDITQADNPILRFLGKEEHYTVHLQDDGVLLGTHYYPHDNLSSYEQASIDVARNLGYRNPERHGMYAEHRPLAKIQGEDGYFLGGRRVDLNGVPRRTRYTRNVVLTIPVTSDVFMLNSYFCADDYSCQGVNHILTPLGNFCLRVSYQMW